MTSDDGGSTDAPRRERAPRRDRNDRNDRNDAPASSDSDIVEVSFEDSFDAELADELGDLGPKSDRPKADRDDGNRRGGGGGRRRHR